MSILRKTVGNDIPFTISFEKDDKLISWAEMKALKVMMKNDQQLGWIKKCDFAISEDGFSINAIFRGSKSSFVGTHRVVVSFVDQADNVISMDSPVFVMVQNSSELKKEVIEYDMGDESGATITTEEGLIVRVKADTYELSNIIIE
jgi:hypothetical protein